MNLGRVYPCFSIDKETILINSKCNKFNLLNTIRGSDPVIFPDNAGLVFDSEESPYFVLESHLINTMDEPLNLTVILKIWVTGETLTMVKAQLEFIL